MDEMIKKTELGFRDIVDLLDPQRIDRTIRFRHLQARRLFLAKELIINNSVKLLRILLAYVLFHKLYIQEVENIESEMKSYSLNASIMQKKKDIGEIINMLDEIFGPAGGWRYVTMICATGYNGGIYTTLDKIATYFEKRDVENYIKFILTTKIPRDDFQKRKALANNFFSTYAKGDYLKEMNITVEEIAAYPQLEKLILDFVEKLSTIRDRIYCT